MPEPRIFEKGIWWWIVDPAGRFSMFPFPSRTAALEALRHAKETRDYE